MTENKIAETLLYNKIIKSTTEVQKTKQEGNHMYNEKNTGIKKASGKKAGIIGGIVVIAAVALFAGRTECDSCGKKFFGSGTVDLLDENYVMCDDCAEDYYFGF